MASRSPGPTLASPVSSRLAGTTFDIALLDPRSDEQAPRKGGAAPAAHQESDEPETEPDRPRERPAKEQRRAPGAPPQGPVTDSTTPVEDTSPAGEDTSPAGEDTTPAGEDTTEKATLGEAPAPPRSGTYGEEGPPKNRIDLLRKFLQTLPLAAKSDPRWLSLPDGLAGTLELVLRLDDGGKLQPIEISPPEAMSTPLGRAVLLNRNFLIHGRFALREDDGQTGEQRLRLRAFVSRATPDEDRPEDPEVKRFGRLDPDLDPEKRSGAFFTYYTGRHIEILVESR